MLNPIPKFQRLSHRSCTLCLAECLHKWSLVLHMSQLEPSAVRAIYSRSNGCRARSWRVLPCRTLHLLEEVAASCGLRGFNQARPPYLPLAKHLPFEPAAAAAAALLDLERQEGIPDTEAAWRNAHGVGVAAGLLKHTAVKADPLAALSQHQTPGEGRASRVSTVPSWLVLMVEEDDLTTVQLSTYP